MSHPTRMRSGGTAVQEEMRSEAPWGTKRGTMPERARHPVTGRWLAYDCETDCLTACAGLCEGSGLAPLAEVGAAGPPTTAGEDDA